MSKLNGLILSGGQSSRMGRDKGALVYFGEDQRTRGFRLLSLFCASVFISCRPDQLEWIEQTQKIPKGLPTICDSGVGQGPGRGMLSAFTCARDRAWLILACDMPWVDEAAITELVTKRNPKKLATVFRSHEGQRSLVEPLFAIWEPAALMRLEEDFKQEQWSPRKTLEKVDCEILPSPSNRVIMNINTWEEYCAET